MHRKLPLCEVTKNDKISGFGSRAPQNLRNYSQGLPLLKRCDKFSCNYMKIYHNVWVKLANEQIQPCNKLKH